MEVVTGVTGEMDTGMGIGLVACTRVDTGMGSGIGAESRITQEMEKENNIENQRLWIWS